MKKIDASEKVYEPIEVVVKGKTFSVRDYDREAAKKNAEWDKRVDAGDTDANYERLLYMLGLEPDDTLLDDLDFRALNHVVSDIFTAIREGDTVEGPEEKKSSARGGKK